MWQLKGEKEVHCFQSEMDEVTLSFLRDMEEPLILPVALPWFETQVPSFSMVFHVLLYFIFN